MLIAELTLAQEKPEYIMSSLLNYLSSLEKSVDEDESVIDAASFDTSVLGVILMRFLRGEKEDICGPALVVIVRKCLELVEMIMTKRGEFHKITELGLRILENVLRLVHEESPKGTFMESTFNSNLLQEMINKTFVLLDSCEPSYHHMIITSILSPVLKYPTLQPLIVDGSLTERIWNECYKFGGGSLNGSLLICLLLGVEEKHEIVRQLLSKVQEDSARHHDFWLTLQTYFMSKDALCRKRAVHILQSVLESIRASTAMNAGVPEDGLGAGRYWLEDYVDVFSHLEGVNSTHLFEQVSAHMTHLFTLSAGCNDGEKDQLNLSQGSKICPASDPKLWKASVQVRQRGEVHLPLPTFAWLKAIVQMLLDLSLPTIRKMTLHCLLSGSAWPIDPEDGSVLDWVSTELPFSLDSSAYFPSPLSSVTADSRGKAEGEARHLLQYPGALLPLFISKLVAGGGSSLEGGDSVRSFLRNLTSTLFVNGAFKGALVATWAFSAFADPSLLQHVPLDTFTELQFRQITSFVGVQLAAANSALQANLYKGLLPLLVKGSNVAGVSGGPGPLLALCDEVGMGVVLAHLPSSPSLLSTALRRVEPSELADLKLSARTKLILHCAWELGGEEDSFLQQELQSLLAFRGEAGKWEGQGDPARLLGALEVVVAAMELLSLQQVAHGHTLVRSTVVSQELAPAAAGLAEGVLARLIKASMSKAKASRTGDSLKCVVTSLSQLEEACTALGRLSLCWHGDACASHASKTGLRAVLDSTISTIFEGVVTTDDVVLSVMSLRALTQLLRGVAEDHGGTGGSSEASAIDQEVASSCLQGLLGLKVPSAGAFGRSLGERQGESASDLVVSVVSAMGTHGRCANAMLRDKWGSVDTLLSVCPDILMGVGSFMGPLLVALADDASTMPVDAMPHFLRAMSTLLTAVVEAEGGVWIADTQAILEAAWACITEGATYLDGPSVRAFVDCLYFPLLVPHFDSSFVAHHHSALLALGKHERPSLIHLVALRLCVLIRRRPELLSVYHQEVLELIFIREPEVNDRQVSNAFSSLEASLHGTATRFTVMALLEELRGREGCREAIMGIVESLAAMNKRADFKAPSMVGSDTYVRKLRCWQCLCLLSPAIDEASLGGILEIYFAAIQAKCLGEIRTHMEIFGALLTRRFSSTLLPRCLGLLEDCNLPQHVQCTIFIILGFILFDLPNSSGPTAATLLPQEDLLRIITVVLPWIGVSSGLSRAIALFLLLDLIPRTEAAQDQGKDDPSSSSGAHLAGIHRMITTNKDSQKVLSRQKNFFRDYPLEGKDSLSGLLAMPQQDGGNTTHGEIVPDNLVNVVQRVFRSAVLESQRDERREVVKSANSTSSEGQDPTPRSILQTKVTPFDELKLELKSNAHSRSLNGALRRRQDLVVCASLVDKVQNLAGIARTCEIFSVESLVMADLGVVKSDTFKGIAVSSDNWLPMLEVKQDNLLSWLRVMRSKGYTILALEQTDHSIILGQHERTSLPEKTVLLVGKEREGIPVEFLQAVDIAVEIPQYGVIRSLNVHVSTAIAIWEMSKSNFREESK